MKISQKQAALLAREIVSQLKKKKADKISDELKEKLIVFQDKRKILCNKKADVQEEINKHDATLYKITGGVKNLYEGDSLQKMIEKIEEKNIPSLSTIEDEIILKSMFNTEEDMEKFVKSIVDRYSKKLQNKILSN